MRPPSWGHRVDLEIPGAAAEAAVIVSEDDWNQHTRDAVVVPAYRDSGRATDLRFVRLTPELVADCTRVQNVAQEDLGNSRGAIGDEEMVRIRFGVRSYLDVDRLLAKAGPRQVLSPRSRWWPEQGGFATQR